MPQSQQSQVYPPIYLLIYALIPAINGFVVLCPFMTCLSDTCLCALLFFRQTLIILVAQLFRSDISLSPYVYHLAF